MKSYVRHDLKRPEYMRAVPRTKPKADEPGQLLTPLEREKLDEVRAASDHLLASIWVHHAPIMRFAIAKGRQVAVPRWAA